MVLNKFLNGLPMLGLLAMLLACPVTDATDGGVDPVTGKPVADGAKGLSEADVKKLIAAGELDGKGFQKLLLQTKKIEDLTKPEQVWKKVSEIMETTRIPDASCTFFYAPSMTSKPHKKSGVTGSFESFYSETVSGTEFKGPAAGKMAAAGEVVFKYDKYSTDGLYELDGEIRLSPSAELDAVAVATGKIYHGGAQAVGTLTIVVASNKLTLTAVKGREEVAGIPEGQKITIEFEAATDGKKFEVSFTKQVQATIKCPLVVKTAEIKVGTIGKDGKAVAGKPVDVEAAGYNFKKLLGEVGAAHTT